MMTSINPKKPGLGNINSNKEEIIPNTVNSLFQRNNYGLEKEGYNDGRMENNMKFKTNSNINFNMNDNNYNQPQLNSAKILNNNEINSENQFKNTNDANKISTNNNLLNLNYNNQNNSINLNLGLQGKKNYSTPILNASPDGNQDMNYNKSFDIQERNQPIKNIVNLNPPQNLNKNRNEGNDEYYLAEIEKLKKEINILKSNNDYLNNQLKEEQRKNEQLFSIQKAKDENENSILSEISHCLQVSSFEEILPKLNEIINYLNNNVNNKNSNQDSNNKIRDELISKMQNLYLSLTGNNEKKEEITIKTLWRWIKHLINTVKQLAIEKEKNIEIYQNMQELDDCKEYCEELISEFNLQSLDELKMFIDNLLKQSNININQGNENQQQEIRNIPMRQMPMGQQQFQMQNYQEDENDEGEAEGEVEGEAEGEEEADENENMDPNQQQYENENEYDENNEMMQQQMELNKEIPNEGNYNFKYDGNVNQGNVY
jgi:hypothetical protein